ncbi:hypothetical protein JTE90_014187 [Oedothorax gibbosus]|uniref:Uncharacterized protein n=1 Tax=Oedothorax gibbosus TaxID=931172 RepID=A0AAV6TGY5_9ARAC|nr:hypothetical protein JTE90_014187 [Oedothorax gibbosus]
MSQPFGFPCTEQGFFYPQRRVPGGFPLGKTCADRGRETGARKLHYLPRFLKGPNRAPPDTARDAVFFYENSVPISGRADSRDPETPYKEKKIFPGGLPRTSPEFGCVTAPVPERTYFPCPGVGGKINPLPLLVGSPRGQKPSLGLRFGRRLAFWNGIFSDPFWGRPDPWFNAVHKGKPLFQLQSPRSHLRDLLLPPKICTGGAPKAPGSPRDPLKHATATPPTHARGKPPRGEALP